MSNIELLSAPFAPNKIHWRAGAMSKDKTKTMALAYLDARDVMERLDEAVGPENWQNKYTHSSPAICSIGIKVDGEWIWKTNGAGETDIEGEKGALSDAFKRAAVLWGVGRYLYDVDSPWVAVDQYKKIVQSEYGKLNSALLNASKDHAHKTNPTPEVAKENNPFEEKQLTPAEIKFKEIGTSMSTATTSDDLERIWLENTQHVAALPEKGRRRLNKHYFDCRKKLTEQKEAA